MRSMGGWKRWWMLIGRFVVAVLRGGCRSGDEVGPHKCPASLTSCCTAQSLNTVYSTAPHLPLIRVPPTTKSPRAPKEHPAADVITKRAQGTFFRPKAQGWCDKFWVVPIGWK